MSLVKVYGPLADFVGQKEFNADIKTAAESIRMLTANFQGLEAHMCNYNYQITVDGKDLGQQDLHTPIGQSDVLITPVIEGAGSNTNMILAGAALIGISFLFPGAGMFGTVSAFGKTAAGGTAIAGFSAGAAWATTAGTVISGLGAALVLGGVSNMLTPIPEIPDMAQDPRVDRSFNFSGIQNTSTAGVAVPVVMGLTLTGSVVISAGIDTVQVEAT